ncbi:hypothetical protein BWQ96_03125 [Gracilariopsis chorda]|uniref:Band 7 domain-containing protein n=1 Tax=Gracilariopsis chorda TaxID=448386 RepID=A0A2V3IY17_9FLOR|nr:hypothetical protein BWQ96_03125 [Gracilariopsis chorda]|eukprot:PXF47048.1 hypothetical protein BWQ96_03125 [Gracilariopsis chorda]
MAAPPPRTAGMEDFTTTTPVPFKPDNNMCMSTPIDWIFPFLSCFILPEKREIVQLFFGKYHGTITEPGCYCRTIIGMEMRHINTDLITFDMANTKVLDARGNPVVISGIVTYFIDDARKAAIDVRDPHRFVHDQAPAVLKRVVSNFPYESDDDSIPSLRSETAIVSDRMRDELQAKCAVAGVNIVTFSINELSYAPEIAQAMLKRQQAEALVQAREAIVRGAKHIAMDAVQDMGTELQLSQEKKAELLGNLLIVLVGDKDVVPTLQVT